MRSRTDAAKIERLMKELGHASRGPGSVFFTGGATAVLLGWRSTTIDVDLKLDPEPPGAFEALARLKDDLDLNVEIASPDDFIPPLPGWRERSRSIGKHGEVAFFHYDLHAQALSKVERGHVQDLDDVRAMIARRLVDPGRLRTLWAEIEPELIRYPAVDPDAFREKLDELLRSVEHA